MHSGVLYVVDEITGTRVWCSDETGFEIEFHINELELSMSKRKVSAEEVVKAKKLAEENYETWGDTVVECYGLTQLVESLEDCESLDQWVQLMKDVHGHRSDIASTAF